MAIIIAVANQKGGVGKTTTTVNLGVALSQMGGRVLLVDLDPQASLTLSLGLDPDDLEATVYTALKSTDADGEGEPPTRGMIVATREGVDLLGANLSLSQADFELMAEPLGVYTLQDALEPVRAGYDYILLDCPPNLGILTTNALTAADEVIIPLQADYLALKGVELLLVVISKIRRRANRRLKVAGVLLTMADLRTRHAQSIIDAAHRTLGGHLPVFETIVKMNVKLKEAPVRGESIFAYDGAGSAAQAYRQLALEVTERGVAAHG